MLPPVASKRRLITSLRRGLAGDVLRVSLEFALCSRRRPFRSFCFADYQLSHVHFASVFRKIPIRTFAFRISQNTNTLRDGVRDRVRVRVRVMDRVRDGVRNRVRVMDRVRDGVRVRVRVRLFSPI